jgi:hypothetical protein
MKEMKILVRYYDKNKEPVNYRHFDLQWSPESAKEIEQDVWSSGHLWSGVVSAQVMPLFTLDGQEFAFDELDQFVNTGDTGLIDKDGVVLPKSSPDEIKELLAQYRDDLVTVTEFPDVDYQEQLEE